MKNVLHTFFQKKTATLLLFLGLILGANIPTVFAQQSIQLTQYMFQKLTYNPAHAGNQEGITVEADFRAQWVGLTGAPLTQVLGVHLPVPLLKGGMGLQLSNDLIGPQRQTSIYAIYAFRQRLGTNRSLSIGLRAGALQQQIKGAELRSPDGEYENGFSHNDVLIPLGSETGLTPDFGIGLELQLQKLTVGLASHSLLEPTIQYNSNEGMIETSQKRHFFVTVDYDLALTNTIRLSPSLLVKSDLNNLQTDISLLATYDDLLKFGASFRGFSPNTFDALAFIVGVEIGEKWLIAYSYDIPISKLQNYSSASHEIGLQYRLKNILPSKGGKTIYNPRFL